MEQELTRTCPVQPAKRETVKPAKRETVKSERNVARGDRHR